MTTLQQQTRLSTPKGSLHQIQWSQHSIDAKESAGGGNKQPGLPLLKPLFTSSSSSASTGHRSNHEHHQHSM
jgi:hypothetical protein